MNSISTTKFGTMLIYDAYGCNPTKLNSPTVCKSIIKRIIKLTNMTPLGNPKIEKCEGNEVLGGKDPGGYSAVQLIQESHISIHTFYRRKFVTIDIYSCTEFDVKEVIKYLDSQFEPTDSDVLKIDRGLKYPDENII